MTLDDVLKEVEEKPSFPKLRVIQGGKGPSDPPSDNWLKKFKKGQVFACKRKNTKVNCEIYTIAYKHAEVTVLYDSLNNNPLKAVMPVEFCREYDFVELINQEEENNGNSVRTLRSGNVEDDADAEGRQPQHD